MKKVYYMSIEATLEVIGGKWKPSILCHLGNGTMRTGELKKHIPQITQKMLVQQLRELEADKIITRKIYNEVPPKVEYSLTEEGKSLRDILIAMSVWGENRVQSLIETGKDVEILSENYSGFLNY
ncbi:MarR family transcriptional regulator [Enterococcus silesiacus]|uniref:Transcriptional regulator n=1 Tax=Enterococcus silesiacus TaxID=332949 RepID=A0A0S3KAH5_9ENTE|nr:helix-turn-helix domain-containing protein [Enterococcus silesiacus]ALS01256.1 MarR family transcriptional regulator [Enterococcus silesiacus]OJG92655.1 transcriptional regulator [Enterococcus silesiacus]